MSKNALILERTSLAVSPLALPALAKKVPSSGEYTELIRRHFQNLRSTVAIVPVGSGQGGGGVCENIATELAASGKQVVIVSVDRLLTMTSTDAPERLGCTPGKTPNVWRWPTAGGHLEFFKSRGPVDPASKWLDVLLLAFDSVLLDCPALEAAPASAQHAAMADGAMLVVEAGRTTRQQIQHDQRALESRGVKLAGCILMQRK
jgi:Mrp family chromosome partitioning ATPase